jgi:hypothetical protein
MYIILDDVDLEETDLATLDDYKTMDKPVLLLKFVIVHDAIYDAF